MLLEIILLFITHLLVPFVFIISMWRSKPTSLIAWVVRVLAYGGFIAYLFLTGAWSWVSVYARWLMLALFVASFVVSLRRVGRDTPPLWRRPRSAGKWLSLGVEVILAVFFVGSTAMSLTGLAPRDEAPIALAWPLRDGVYHVVHGGSNPILNSHNVDRAQRYALDVVQVHGIGVRARGFYPEDLDRYTIFDRPLYSPCSGEVLETENGFPDHIPPDTDRENPAGNHVLVRCAEQGVDVILAHMREGSVAVTPGQSVQEGDLLGHVGNSGNTSEPHLHIHAVTIGSGSILEGAGAPLHFDDRFLVRNSLLAN